MERLTKREGKHTVRIGNEWRRHDRAWDKLAKYEDLEERCIKETTWSLKELLYKWKVFYESIAELYNYRKLEEQGLLLRLPIKTGDTIWFIGSKCCYCEEDDCYGCNYNINGDKRHERFVYEMKVEQFRIRNDYISMVNSDMIFSSREISLGISEIGKTIFLTKEEAEAALKKMKGE